MPLSSRLDSMREPLDAALAIQIEKLERVTVRGLAVLSGGGAILGLLVAATISRGLGLACGATSGVLLVWFLVYSRLLGRGPARPVLRTVGTVIESTIPWLFLVVMALLEGPVFALASWLPPMLFCALMFAYAARLRPRACIVLGVTGAIVYTAAYALIVYERLPPASASLLITRPTMQISRVASLLAAAGIGAFVARGMRFAIGRAESAVRAQDLFGKYRLVRQIASGGMGIVFEAIYCPEGGFERRVAVKRIHPHLAADHKFVDAFRDEAELSARLAHPNVVQVLDFGRVADSFFLALEYVDGLTLHALVHHAVREKRTLSPGVVGFVMRQVLSGLVHAHEGARGADGRLMRVVHRDLCPPNVLVSRNGEVKLTDFGIARSLSDAAVSMTMNVAGHVGYMAPEQARATVFDVRADLFPVGVIAWELFTLRPLFRRQTEVASLEALLHADVPKVIDSRAEIDPRWDEFIARATARDPERRFRRATEMLEALDGIGDSESPRAAEELGALVESLLLAKQARRAQPIDQEEPAKELVCEETPTQVLAAPIS